MAEPRRGRGRMSRIDGLPPELKREVDALLRSGLSQEEIRRRLRRPFEDAGVAPLSQSGLSRYAVRMEGHLAAARETRALADHWIAHLGDDPAGEVGQLAIEILRTLITRRVLAASPDPDEDDANALDAKELGELALASQRLERALEISRAGEAKMRAALAEEAAEAARSRGVERGTADRIRDILMGKGG